MKAVFHKKSDEKLKEDRLFSSPEAPSAEKPPAAEPAFHVWLNRYRKKLDETGKDASPEPGLPPSRSDF